jgi:hypothetical protein
MPVPRNALRNLAFDIADPIDPGPDRMRVLESLWPPSRWMISGLTRPQRRRYPVDDPHPRPLCLQFLGEEPEFGAKLVDSHQNAGLDAHLGF